MRPHANAQLSDFRGVIGWNAFTTYVDGAPITRPALEIPLYIKDHPIPLRKPKITEVTTMPTMDPGSGKDTSIGAVFWGAPDLLQITISGWIITPLSGQAFYPTVDGSLTGAALNLGNLSYAEVISAYLEGRMNQTKAGLWQRKDPDYYVTPYGHRFDSPTVGLWEPQYSVNMRKQPFSMMLYLEK